MATKSVISLLSWDSPVYLENLLRDLTDNTPGHDFSLIIVDQGSEPEVKALLRAFVRLIPNVTVRFLRDNIGYAGGHNFAYELMSGQGAFEYFVTINNDLMFGQAGWLDTLVAAMALDPQAGLGGPICCSLRPTPLSAPEDDYVFVCGAVTIIRASVAAELGLFDTAFQPAYGEDVDMCRRYEFFGHHQRHIPIPVEHEYLPEVPRVAVSKRAVLSAQYGDFPRINKVKVYQRWWLNPPALKSPADLATVFPGLYIPGRAADRILG